MNNLKKIGLSALAGSLVSFSAGAAEMSVSGGAAIYFDDTNRGKATRGNGFYMGDSLNFAASGETDGGLSVAGDAVFGDDIKLVTDAAVASFGQNGEITLTHVHNTGLLLEDSGGSPTLQFHDAGESVSSDGSKLILTSNSVAFDMPTADGNANEVLKTDGSGALSFTAISSNAITSGDTVVNTI